MVGVIPQTSFAWYTVNMETVIHSLNQRRRPSGGVLMLKYVPFFFFFPLLLPLYI